MTSLCWVERVHRCFETSQATAWHFACEASGDATELLAFLYHECRVDTAAVNKVCWVYLRVLLTVSLKLVLQAAVCALAFFA